MSRSCLLYFACLFVHFSAVRCQFLHYNYNRTTHIMNCHFDIWCADDIRSNHRHPKPITKYPLVGRGQSRVPAHRIAYVLSVSQRLDLSEMHFIRLRFVSVYIYKKTFFSCVYSGEYFCVFFLKRETDRKQNKQMR